MKHMAQATSACRASHLVKEHLADSSQQHVDRAREQKCSETGHFAPWFRSDGFLFEATEERKQGSDVGS